MDPTRVAGSLGNGIEATASVPSAIAAFLGAPDDPTAVVARAVTMGGATDTVAAMAGPIVDRLATETMR